MGVKRDREEGVCQIGWDGMGRKRGWDEGKDSASVTMNT